MGRSAQAVNLRRGLVGDPVSCLVRCFCQVFNLGARWIVARRIETGTAACETATDWGGSIHRSSFRGKSRDGNTIDATVAFVAVISIFQRSPTIRRSLISS